MKTGEKQVSKIEAINIKTSKNKRSINGVSITVKTPHPWIFESTEILFTANELKKMIKECENAQ